MRKTYTYQADFYMGEPVYLRTDPDQHMRLCVKHVLYPDGTVMYGIACGTLYSEHYALEVTTDKTY